MADIALEDSMSMGEPGFPATLPLSNLSSKTKVNGKSVVLKDYTICDSYAEAYYYLLLKNNEINFIYKSEIYQSDR